jgi:uncharacterized membrane protein
MEAISMSSTEDSLLFLYNLIGRLVCHQLPERTLWVGGHYLPVCARDTGVYLGFFLGYILLIRRRKDSCGPPNLWMTSLMVLPMIIDAGTQWVGLRTSTNELRLITGLLFGVAIAPFLVYSISIISISKTIPVLRRLLPKAVDFADKENWIDYKTLISGALLAVALYAAITLVVGSTYSLFYWLLSSALIISVIIHIFLLPAFIIGLLLLTIYSRVRGAIIPNSLDGNSTRIDEAQITALLSRNKQNTLRNSKG